MRVTALLFLVGCAASPTSSSDEALTCDVGAPGSLASACVKASVPKPVGNGATITANDQAYGVRLTSTSAGYQATVHLTAPQSGTYEIYLSSETIPLEVVDTQSGYDVGWSCMSAITSTECAYLRHVTTVYLTEGRPLDLKLGPYRASYVRVYVQLREQATSNVCTSDELPEEPAACTAADDGQTSITANALTSTSPHVYATDTVYLATLPSTGGSSYGGMVAFRAPHDGNYELYLGTPNIPIRMVDANTSMISATCSTYIPSTECDRLRRGSLLTLHGGDVYHLELGPYANTHYVRVELRESKATNPIKLGPPQLDGTNLAAYCVTAGDLDGDGVLDLAVSAATDQAPGVNMLRGTGSGTFTTIDRIATQAPGETVIADFNRDGIADVAGIANDGMGPLPDFYLQGTGGFAYSTTTWGHSRDFVASLSSADFDEDGTPEIVSSYPDTESGGPGGFVITKLPGDVVVQDEPAFGADTLQAVAGDFNGDHHQDVIAASRGSSAVQLFYGNGTGTVAFASQIALPGSRIRTIAAFDLDRDGRSDLVATFWDGTASVSYGTATGLSAPAPLPDSGSAIAAGDFDHDGRLDLAFTAPTTGTPTIAIDLATSSGFVHAGALDAPHGAGLNLAVGDFNRDGFDDLVAPSNDAVTVYLSTP